MNYDDNVNALTEVIRSRFREHLVKHAPRTSEFDFSAETSPVLSSVFRAVACAIVEFQQCNNLLRTDDTQPEPKWTEESLCERIEELVEQLMDEDLAAGDFFDALHELHDDVCHDPALLNVYHTDLQARLIPGLYAVTLA